MSVVKKKSPVAQAKTAARPPRKLVPRVAAPVEPVAVAAAEVTPVERVEQVAAANQKVLAQAKTVAAPVSPSAKAVKPAKKAVVKPAKEEKPVKIRKPKLVRDSYAMPEEEYARIGELKKRMTTLGAPAKKSELLRAGVAVLYALNDAELKAVMARVARIKTGRPAK